MKTWTLMAAALALLCSDAAADDVLCKTRSGSLKVRAECKRSEAAVDAATLGLQGPPGPQGVEGPAGPSLVVKDANGTMVGLWSPGGPNHPSPNGALLTVPGYGAVQLPIVDDAWLDAGSPVLHFSTSDCSGTTYFRGEVGRMVKPALVQRGSVHYGEPPLVDVDVRSNLVSPMSEADCTAGGRMFIPPDGCCFRRQAATTEKVGVHRSFDVSGFVPPFHVDGP